MSLLQSALADPMRKKYGLNILFGDKEKNPKAGGSWEQWQQNPQAESDITNFYEKGQNVFTNYGYVAGYKDLSDVDFDWPWVYPLVKEKLEGRAESRLIKTPNGGFRLLSFSEKVESPNEFKSTLHLEIHQKNYIATGGEAEKLDGSMGRYELIKDLGIVTDPSLLKDILEICGAILKKYKLLQYPCIFDTFNKKRVKLDHSQRLDIANLLVNECQIGKKEAARFFSICGWDDYNPAITEEQIDSTIKRIKEKTLNPPKCETLREHFRFIDNDEQQCRKCPRKRSLKKPISERSEGEWDEKRIYKYISQKDFEGGLRVVLDDGETELRGARLESIPIDLKNPPPKQHVEEIMWGDSPVFLVYTAASGDQPEKIEYTTEIEISCEEKVSEHSRKRTVISYAPIPVDEKLAEALTLPDGVEEYGSVSLLRKEMLDLTLEVFDPVSSPDIIKVINDIYLTSWYAPRWMEKYVEKFIPVISFRGPSETGKKRGLTTARWMAYRPIYALKTTKVPSLFRVVDPWKGTLVLDEADLRESSESAEFVEFINSRADGAPIPRYSTEKGGIEWFYSFGLTVTATRKPYYDDGIESRILVFPAESTDNPGKYPLIPPEEWLVKARSLQRKLLLFRLRHLHGDIPSNLLIPGVKGFRVREALLALQALEKEDPGLMENIAETAKKLERRVIADRANSPEGLVLNHVYGALDDDDVKIERDKLHWIVLTSYVKEGGERIHIPLTLRRISDGLGRAFSPSEIARIWRGLGQDTNAQIKLEGKRYRGVLCIKTPGRLNREFQKYVPDAMDIMSGFKITQQELHDVKGEPLVPPVPPGSPVTSVTDEGKNVRGTSNTPALQPVPPVPPVPSQPPVTHDVKGGDSFETVPLVPSVPPSRVYPPTTQNLEIKEEREKEGGGGDTMLCGTSGTSGTAQSQPDIQTPTLPAHDARDRVQTKLLMVEVLTDVGNMALYNPENKLITADLRKGDIASLPEVQARALISKGAAKEIHPSGHQGPAQNQLQGPPEEPKHRFDMPGILQQMICTIWAQPTNARAVEATLENMVNTGHTIDPTWTKATLRRLAEGALRERGWV